MSVPQQDSENLFYTLYHPGYLIAIFGIIVSIEGRTILENGEIASIILIMGFAIVTLTCFKYIGVPKVSPLISRAIDLQLGESLKKLSSFYHWVQIISVGVTVAGTYKILMIECEHYLFIPEGFILIFVAALLLTSLFVTRRDKLHREIKRAIWSNTVLVNERCYKIRVSLPES